MIDVKAMTLVYSSKKGVFDLNFHVQNGEVVAILGSNGAGKTTLIRALMGFMKPQQGHCRIDDLDCFEDSSVLHHKVGWIPGEMTFFSDMTGKACLKLISDMRGMKDLSYQKKLLELFELNPKGKIKKYSKGMKQKLGIVIAFMHDPDILILDEPTSGLDPFMQKRFVELLLDEKKRGKTILIASHIFEEVEKTADRVLMIKDGKIISDEKMDRLKASQRKKYMIRCIHQKRALEVLKEYEPELEGDSLLLKVNRHQLNQFIGKLSSLDIVDLCSKNETFEELLMEYYKGVNES